MATCPPLRRRGVPRYNRAAERLPFPLKGDDYLKAQEENKFWKLIPTEKGWKKGNKLSLTSFRTKWNPEASARVRDPDLAYIMPMRVAVDRRYVDDVIQYLLDPSIYPFINPDTGRAYTREEIIVYDIDSLTDAGVADDLARELMEVINKSSQKRDETLAEKEMYDEQLDQIIVLMSESYWKRDMMVDEQIIFDDWHRPLVSPDNAFTKLSAASMDPDNKVVYEISEDTVGPVFRKVKRMVDGQEVEEEELFSIKGLKKYSFKESRPRKTRSFFQVGNLPLVSKSGRVDNNVANIRQVLDLLQQKGMLANVSGPLQAYKGRVQRGNKVVNPLDVRGLRSITELGAGRAVREPDVEELPGVIEEGEFEFTEETRPQVSPPRTGVRTVRPASRSPSRSPARSVSPVRPLEGEVEDLPLEENGSGNGMGFMPGSPRTSPRGRVRQGGFDVPSGAHHSPSRFARSSPRQ